MIAWCGAPAAPVVNGALAALSLHGRDSQGLWDGGSASLGWRQTILHAEDYFDRQPLTGGGGSLRLVFDGRIDNRAALARTLAIFPEQARDWPDSAYALSAFEKWGPECVDKLLGDFAFAVWNERTRQLFLARDHIGAKPLYFYRGDRSFFMFASQPSALFTNARVPRDIDDSNLIRSLAFVRLAPGATVYRGIERVPIGTGLLVSESAAISLRHWNPESIPALRYKRDDDYVDAFRSILDEAVECRLRSIHPVGSHLSSGWDSSTVTATAARLLGARNDRLVAFTAAPPATWREGVASERVISDESTIAAAVAQQYSNIEHVVIRGPGRLDLSSLDRLGDTSEYPHRTVNNAGWLEKLNMAARERGIRVILGGAMGNRTISYDGMGFLPRLFRHAQLWELSREWMALHRRGHSHLKLGARALGPYLPVLFWDLLMWLARRPGRMHGAAIGFNPLAVDKKLLREIAESRRPAGTICMDDRATRKFCTQTPDAVLIWGGSLAAYDVETREPLGDRRLMTFRAAIPERQFLCKGKTKWLIRRAMDGILPEVLASQRGRGLQAAEWFEAAGESRGLLGEEVDRLAANARMESLFDIPLLRGLIDGWPVSLSDADQATRYTALVIVISGARFARRFLEARVEKP
jgi:asparagine synthase (glutamine-hydrolysing)